MEKDTKNTKLLPDGKKPKVRNRQFECVSFTAKDTFNIGYSTDNLDLISININAKKIGFWVRVKRAWNHIFKKDYLYSNYAVLDLELEDVTELARYLKNYLLSYSIREYAKSRYRYEKK